MTTYSADNPFGNLMPELLDELRPIFARHLNNTNIDFALFLTQADADGDLRYEVASSHEDHEQFLEAMALSIDDLLGPYAEDDDQEPQQSAAPPTSRRLQ